MALTNEYVVNGHFDFNPSKLSETVGLRVYSKLKPAKGLFFRNPSLMGLYSENLRPGDIEFIFGVDTDQVPFIGKLKVMLLVKDNATNEYKVVEHPVAQLEYSLLSTDIAAPFSDKERPFFDKDLWTSSERTQIENYRELFYKWVKQRKDAYYEGFRVNQSADARIWHIEEGEDDSIVFDEVKLILAQEYWWFMRLGYIKPGEWYTDVEPDMSQIHNDPSLGNMRYEGEYVISLNIGNFKSRVEKERNKNGKEGYGNVSGVEIWLYDATANAKPNDEERNVPSNWMHYYQDYFLFTENEDDNDVLVTDKIENKNLHYNGGLVNLGETNAAYLSNIMRFKRPWDEDGVLKEGAIKNHTELTFYKVKMRMNTPGERYYVGVYLIHKQELLGGQNSFSKFNSDIVFSPMISRANTPDWLDNDTDFLNPIDPEDADALTKFLGKTHIQGEGVEWDDNDDINNAYFNLMWGVQSTVKKDVTYYNNNFLEKTKFYLQVPYVFEDEKEPTGIPLVELKPGENSLAQYINDSRTKSGDATLDYKHIDSNQASETPSNTCEVLSPSLTLSDPQNHKEAVVTEVKNSQVRKFFIFYTEKIENYFKLQTEPIDITNRDWANTKTPAKFDPASKYVIRRYDNDVNDAKFEVRYKRNAVVKDEHNAKSTEYYSVNGYDVYRRGATPDDDVMVTDPAVLDTLTIDTTTPDYETTSDFAFNGVNFISASSGDIVPMVQVRGTLQMTITNRGDHTLPDLTPNLNPPDYVSSTNNSGDVVDAFKIIDKISISEAGFEKAKQRAYCMAAIIPTDLQEQNYYIYTNVKEGM